MTKQVGDQAEAAVLAKLVAQGRSVSIPFGENHRYDLLIDDDGEFSRVQCKSGVLRGGVVKFNTYSSHWHRGRTSKGYAGEADLFGVYCAELDQVYMVPVQDVPEAAHAHLRIDQPKNGQSKGIRWASDYEIE